MSFGKGSSTTTQQQTQAPNPAAMAAYQDLISRAQGVASTPYMPYTGELAAPTNQQQQLGVGGINQYASAAQPAFYMAENLGLGAAQPLTAGQIQNYQNPFTQQVINATPAQYNQNNAVNDQMLLGNAASRGALGNSRVDLARSQLLGQEGLGQDQAIAGLYAQGYGQAAQMAAQQYQQNPMAAAYFLANTGANQQAAGLQGAQAQFGAGTQEQQTQQLLDTLQLAQYNQQQAFPYAQTGWLAGVTQGTAPLMGGTTYGTTTAPPPNPFTQMAGLGVTALGAYGGAGGFRSQARGGRVAGFDAGGAAPMPYGGSGALYGVAGGPYGVSAPQGGVQARFPSLPAIPHPDQPTASPDALKGAAGLGKMFGTSPSEASIVDDPNSAYNQGLLADAPPSEITAAWPEGADLMGGSAMAGGEAAADTGMLAGLGEGVSEALPFLLLAKRGGRVPGFQEGGDVDTFDDRFAPAQAGFGTGSIMPSFNERYAPAEGVAPAAQQVAPEFLNPTPDRWQPEGATGGLSEPVQVSGLGEVSPAPAPMRSARGSWYSQAPGWVDRGDRPGSNALGVPDSQQGIALPSRKTLGQWFDVRAPNGQTYRLQQTDVGPARWTGRGIDISAAAANRMGYKPENFPTDARFAFAPAAGPQHSPEELTALNAVSGPPEHPTAGVGADDTGGALAYDDEDTAVRTPGERKAGFSLGNASPAFWQGIMGAGLGMMASRSPFAGVGIGEGGMQGLAQYGAAKREEILEAREGRMAAALKQQVARQGRELQLKEQAGRRAEEEAEFTRSKPGEIQGALGKRPYVWDPKTKQFIYLDTKEPIAGGAMATPTNVPKSDDPERPFKAVTNPTEATMVAAKEQGLRGQAFLDAVPSSIKNRLEAVANYQAPLSSFSVSGRGGRGMARDDALELVRQMNPDYDPNWYTLKGKALNNFYASTAPNSPVVLARAGNTAVGHGGDLAEAFAELHKLDPNGAAHKEAMGFISSMFAAARENNIPLLSQLAAQAQARVVKGTAEGAAWAKIAAIAPLYAAETAKFYSGSSGSETERQQIQAPFNPNLSFPEVMAAMQAQAHMFKSKTDPLEQEFSDALDAPGLKEYGTSKPHKKWQVMKENAQRSLQRIDELATEAGVGKGGADAKRKAALDWLAKNPNDPDAPAVRKRLGIP